MLIWKIKVYVIYIYHTLVYNLLSYKDINRAIVKSASFLPTQIFGWGRDGWGLYASDHQDSYKLYNVVIEVEEE